MVLAAQILGFDVTPHCFFPYCLAAAAAWPVICHYITTTCTAIWCVADA
jgi:hypothetical protein